MVENNDSHYKIMLIFGDDNNNKQIRIIGDIEKIEIIGL